MKFREFVNLIDDKIDYLFRRGKNADERCYDYFIRTVTFFVVVLIVLCYASFAHAESAIASEYTTIGEVFDYAEFFDSTQFNQYLSESNLTTADISGYGILAGAQYYRPSMDWIKSIKIPTSITLNDITYTPEQYIIVVRRGNVYADGEQLIGIDIGVGNNIFVPNGSPDIIAQYNSSGSEVMAVATANFHSYSDTPYGSGYTFQTINSLTDTTTRTFNYNYYGTNMSGQYYYFIGSSKGYTIDGLSQNEINDFWYTYAAYEDKRIQLNYQYAEANPEEPETETENNENHMYFNSVKMGLTAQGENNNLSSSSLVIGCEVDNYIKNHIDEYKVYVSCQLNYKDSIYTSNPTFGEIMPLSLFYNQAYVKGLSEIFGNMPWGSPYASFYAYYRNLNDSYNLFTRNEAGKNGRLEVPTLTDIKEYIIGVFKTDINKSNIPNDYSISTFQLDVSVVLTDSDTFDNKSGVYTQRFDFINGNTSIIKAEGLVNNNPWEGESTPQVDPFPNGSSFNNGGVVQNNNQTVTINNNNNWSNIVNGVGDEQTDASRNLLDAMKNIKESFASMTSESDDTMGFIPFLGESLSSFPGINYIVWSIVIIFSLLVVVFLIKAIFL